MSSSQSKKRQVERVHKSLKTSAQQGTSKAAGGKEKSPRKTAGRSPLKARKKKVSSEGGLQVSDGGMMVEMEQSADKEEKEKDEEEEKEKVDDKEEENSEEGDDGKGGDDDKDCGVDDDDDDSDDDVGDVEEGHEKGKKEKNVNKRGRHKCDECNYGASTLVGLHKHIDRVHGSGATTFACYLCDFETTWSRDYNQHMKGHYSGPPFLCDFAGCRVQVCLSCQAKL
jgi:hypothetical protein